MSVLVVPLFMNHDTSKNSIEESKSGLRTVLFWCWWPWYLNYLYLRYYEIFLLNSWLICNSWQIFIIIISTIAKILISITSSMIQIFSLGVLSEFFLHNWKVLKTNYVIVPRILKYKNIQVFPVNPEVFRLYDMLGKF